MDIKQKTIDELYKALAHGDDEHKAWLKEAITAYFNGKPIPPPRDNKTKEKYEKES